MVKRRHNSKQAFISDLCYMQDILLRWGSNHTHTMEPAWAVQVRTGKGPWKRTTGKETVENPGVNRQEPLRF